MIDLFTFSPWQMTPGERAALEGTLSQLEPDVSIEIGTAEGGSLRRIAAHSGHVHSFDLVRPALLVEEWGNVTLHTGDSHALLPALLAALSGEGQNVDFVMVDGDHSADGVERDLNDLLASPAVGRTVVLIHDTANDEVRRGVDRVPFDRHEHVAHWNPDFVAGHLSYGGDYHHQLWGGLGLLIVDREARRPSSPTDGPGFYGMLELLTRVRDALSVAEAAGLSVEPGAVPTLHATGIGPSQAEVDRLRLDLANARSGAAAMEQSLSWRLTAPLRMVRQRLRRSGD
jgi:hypothetical protein